MFVPRAAPNGLESLLRAACGGLDNGILPLGGRRGGSREGGVIQAPGTHLPPPPPPPILLLPSPSAPPIPSRHFISRRQQLLPRPTTTASAADSTPSLLS